MIQYRKLQKLADHLRRGKLGHAKFDFGIINGGDPQIEVRGRKIKANPCGTAGCAIGELPIVFPKDWEYPDPEITGVDDDGLLDVTLPIAPNPKFSCAGDTIDERVAEFFCISNWAVDHLFYPGSQDTELFGGVKLDSNATKLRVAKNIEAFIKKMKGNK